MSQKNLTICPVSQFLLLKFPLFASKLSKLYLENDAYGIYVRYFARTFLMRNLNHNNFAIGLGSSSMTSVKCHCHNYVDHQISIYLFRFHRYYILQELLFL